MGLQFENLIVNNYTSLIPLLHLNDVLLTSAAPIVETDGYFDAIISAEDLLKI